MKRKHGFLRNAAILTFTSLLLRAAGMYFRIYLSGVVGAEGMGLYQMLISVYTLLAGFASSGIPIAVTRLTADALARKDGRSVRHGLRKCLSVSIGFAVISSAGVLICAGLIGGRWLSDARAVMSVRMMAGALPFMAVSCCLRGYFTARRRVGVSSCSQIAEQFARIALSVALLGRFAPRGIEWSCFSLVLADVLSEGVGCMYIAVGYMLDRGKIDVSHQIVHKVSYKEIFDITTSITLSHYLTTLLHTVESVLVPDCLTVFYLSRTRSLELFGMLRGMALPLIFFPSTVLGAIASLLVPELSACLAVGDKGGIKRSVGRTMRVTFMLAMPVSAVFFMFGRELGQLVYGRPEVGSLLCALSPLLPLMYSESVAVGLLRGLGEHKRTFVYGVADCVMRIALICLLVPRLGMTGFLMVMTLSNILTPALNLARLLKVSGASFDIAGWALRPLFFSAVSVSALFIIKNLPLLDGAGRVIYIAAGVLALSVSYALLTALSDGNLIERARSLSR